MLSQISVGVPMRIATPEKCQRRKARYRVVDRGKIRYQRPKRQGGDTKALTLPARISGTIDVQAPKPPAPTLRRKIFMAEPFPVGLRLYLDRPFVSANDN